MALFIFLIGAGLLWYGYKNKQTKLALIGGGIVGLFVVILLPVFIPTNMIIWIILLGAIYWFGKKFWNSMAIDREIKTWKKQNSNNKKPEQFFSEVKQITRNYGRDSSLDVPIGRAVYFSQSDDSFKSLDADADFLSYSGTSSKDEKNFSFLEYGWLVSSEGIYYRSQDKAAGKWSDNVVYIPLSGAYKIVNDIVYYADKSSIRLNQIKSESESYLKNIILDAIDTGYTRNLYQGTFDTDSEINNLVDNTSDIDKSFTNATKNMDLSQNIPNYSNMGSAISRNNSVQESQLNQAINGTQGHGVSAEWGNTVVDRFKGHSVTSQVGGTNLKYGADRSVSGVGVQTKYYQTYNNGVADPGNARASVNAYLKNIDGYFSNGAKQVEVPKDQFNDAISRMRKAIIDGKVPGENNPDNAGRYVRKGSWTYDQSLQIAKSGTIPSLKVDVLGGIESSIYGASLGAVITYWNVRSNGMEIEDALKITGGVFVKSMVIGTLTYTGTMQMTKWLTNSGSTNMLKSALTKYAGEVPEEVFKRLNIAVTLTIQMAPSLTKAIEGKQGWSDVGADLTTATTGLGGMWVGAAIGTAIFPVGGGIVGGLIGSFASGFVGSKLGKIFFGESSQTQMMNILKEEFIDAVYQSPLNQNEIQKIMQDIFNDKKLKKTLGNMYKSEDRKTFAKENIIYPYFQLAYKARPTVSETEFNNLDSALVSAI